MVDKHGLVALYWEIKLFATRMEQEECFVVPDVRSPVLGKPLPPPRDPLQSKPCLSDPLQKRMNEYSQKEVR